MTGREVSAAELSLLNHLVVTGEVDPALLRRVRDQRESWDTVVLNRSPGDYATGPYWRGRPAYFYWCPDCGFTVQIGVDGAAGEAVKHPGCATFAFLHSVVDVVVDFMVAVGK